jgi:hypothetical protein
VNDEAEIQDQEKFEIPMIHGFEASMLNCFGLKELHHYLNLPYLSLKRDILYEQLRRSADDLLYAAKTLEVSPENTSYSDYASNYTKVKSTQPQTSAKVLEKYGVKSSANSSTSSSTQNSSVGQAENVVVTHDVPITKESSSEESNSDSDAKQKVLTKEEKRRKFREKNGGGSKTDAKSVSKTKQMPESSGPDDMNAFIQDRY